MTEERKNLFGKPIHPRTGRDDEEGEKIKSDNIKPKTEGESPSKAAADRAFAGKAAADQKAAGRAGARAEAGTPRKGTVKVRSLQIRKDHSMSSAEVDGVTIGEKVTILDTWSDGKNTWAKLGPERWAAIIYNGETLIELS
jgi:hypothetical protein